MSEILVSRTDFVAYRPLPATLDFEREIEPCIIRAQRGWVRDALGAGLYRSVWTTQTGANATLINGGSYEFNGQTVDYFGLKPAIVMYAYALYIGQSDMKLTRAGNRQKRSSTSDVSPADKVSNEESKAMGEAQGYMADAICFLHANASDYPLWQGGRRKEVRGAIRIGLAPKPTFYSEDYYDNR
jgi:hypothetical protein